VKSLLKLARSARFVRPGALLMIAAIALGACEEKLEGGSACPLRHPQQQALVQEDTLFAVSLDTSIAGYPTIGREVVLFLASFGDTLQTRGVVRYDSLKNTFHHINSATDSAVVSVDSSFLFVNVVRRDTLGPSGTLEAYDVDLNGAEETDPTAVSSAFTPDRLLGSKDYTARDSIVGIPIDAGKLLAKIQAPYPANRLRVGLRVTEASGASTHLLVPTSETALTSAPQLSYRPSANDSTVGLEVVLPRSDTPPDPFVASDLRDYLVVAKGPAPPPADVLRVGGLPGYRPYLKFDIPSRIIDSSNVVRATLLLNQRPNGLSAQSGDTIALEPFAVVSGPAVTDISKALLFLFAPTPNDTLRTVPAEGGLRSVEIIRIVKLWAATTADKTPRALSLHPVLEGQNGQLVDFYSTEAAPALRPRLRITYLPRHSGGIP